MLITEINGNKIGLSKGGILSAYAIGELYWSSNSTSPATLMGGSWERVKDRFILAAGDAYSAGSSGGEATHTLTISEMPLHRHIQAGKTYYGGSETNWKYSGTTTTTGTANYTDYASTGNPSGGNITNYVGGGETHNNMPPYKVYYCWERIA